MAYLDKGQFAEVEPLPCGGSHGSPLKSGNPPTRLPPRCSKWHGIHRVNPYEELPHHATALVFVPL
ncbi:hypothetical protein [Dendronalium sp. ChiSLP03b]|uniref:hypothetical protein n=1 Tax=Dendronalium sp. ChiSLP03b TaxID=3075381 RepID=UPI002AD40995|nr:hypothetical protein [Dendronalium sp. ChiSLP03b]MDZ8208491.1 hypothetical protein [Dendronalium sp. ChiSLP03b]